MPITAIPEGLLWPPSSARDMPPGAIEDASGYAGPGLDLGALRTGEDGFLETLVARTPTAADPRNGEWVHFDAGNPEHVRKARLFGRYGPGVSHGSQTHDDVVNWYEEVNGPQAPGWRDSMHRWDIEYDAKAKAALLAALKAKQGQGPSGGAEAELLRTRLADAIKAREDLEKQVFVREETLKAERAVLVKLQAKLTGVLDKIAAKGADVISTTKEKGGGVPAQNYRKLGKFLLTLAAETREKLGE